MMSQSTNVSYLQQIFYSDIHSCFMSLLLYFLFHCGLFLCNIDYILNISLSKHAPYPAMKQSINSFLHSLSSHFSWRFCGWQFLGGFLRGLLVCVSILTSFSAFFGEFLLYFFFCDFTDRDISSNWQDLILIALPLSFHIRVVVCLSGSSSYEQELTAAWGCHVTSAW